MIFAEKASELPMIDQDSGSPGRCSFTKIERPIGPMISKPDYLVGF